MLAPVRKIKMSERRNESQWAVGKLENGVYASPHLQRRGGVRSESNNLIVLWTHAIRQRINQCNLLCVCKQNYKLTHLHTHSRCICIHVSQYCYPYLTFSWRLMYIFLNWLSFEEPRSWRILTATCSGSTDKSNRSCKKMNFFEISWPLQIRKGSERKVRHSDIAYSCH
jgi:hypothetical protein